MLRAAEMGTVIFPPVPAFYHVSKTIEGIIDQIVEKVLDIFNIEHHLFRRWNDESSEKAVEFLNRERGKNK